jgi:hypothetical protein
MDEQQTGQNNPQLQQPVTDGNSQPAIPQPPFQPPQEQPQQAPMQPAQPLAQDVVETPDIPEAQPLPPPDQEQQNDQPQYQYQSGNLQPNGQIGQPESPESQGNLQNKSAGDSVSWSASEFVHHEKSSGWHIIVIAGALILGVAIYFLTKSIFGAVIIALVGIIFSIFGALKPKVLDYSITPKGVQIGNKHFDYLSFRSFAVIEDGQMPSLQLLPQKRFAVPITIYFSPADKDHIADVLGEYLPFEHQERDLVDKLSSKLRF